MAQRQGVAVQTAESKKKAVAYNVSFKKRTRY